MGTNNAINLNSQGVAYYNGTGTFSGLDGISSGYVLTSNGSGNAPSFQAASGGSGITTIDGDSGSITGSTVKISAGLSILNCGSTVSFVNSGTTSTLNVTDQTNGTTIIGAGAGPSGTPSFGYNACTGFGFDVLSQVGSTADCRLNSAFGVNTLGELTGGQNNAGCGCNALGSLATGASNTSVGSSSLTAIPSGTGNTSIGFQTGLSYVGSESYNILLGYDVEGVASESNVLRIGDSTSSEPVTAAYIGGIHGVTVTGAAVLCSTAGQLGTISSSREFKENIHDIADRSSRLMQLRPVQFNYISDKDKNICYGMIAEEVEKIFPELVLYERNEPISLKYHEMAPLLLNEMKKMAATIADLQKRIHELESKR